MILIDLPIILYINMFLARRAPTMAMFDFVFDWRPEMNLGIEIIDEQHQRLFKTGRDIEQLLRFQCIGVNDKQLLDIVCELRDYVAYHFYEEEMIMDKSGYSNFEKHKNDHADFGRFIQNINLPNLKANPNKVLKDIKNRVQDMIFQHILIEDVTMAKEIKSRYEFLKKYFEIKEVS